ncbi:glutathione S-transferase [Paludibacterium paludis]|uniref:GST N-terminal domain-containing protein n=1 Tax=Paludibacterium paludis TaxID=1225769 RepID=A0A918NWM7_9NEIS|nr:glutathione S-transferase [Paludibacterium paludis]GGY02719.1 hypothetical protein GCM10011289_01070 [Paludibacterium paludis]
MQLIGMLDSPYVRRVAIALQRLEVRFEHRPLSVFSTYPQFRDINPVVKAPSLVCDDGEVLMDSTLILDYAQTIAAPRKNLLPAEPDPRRRALRLTGLALAACEKSVQIIYEQELRPADKRHTPWLERVTEQTLAAFGEMEAELDRHPLPAPTDRIGLDGISVAVAWRFAREKIPGLVAAETFPALRDYSSLAETLPAFIAAPFGPGVCRPD